MARRRTQQPAQPDNTGVPRWMFHFRFGEWAKGCSPEQPDLSKNDPTNPREMVEYCGARRRWRQARTKWLRENGRIMSAVYPELYAEYEKLAAREPWRVVVPDWEAESDDMRKRIELLPLSSGEDAAW